MRRIAVIALVIVAAVAVLALGTAAGGDEDVYEVRAIFDSAGFLVEGEEVRVAGANVGVVSDVSVTGNDEPALEDGGPDPGKAVVVLRIDDPAFQDFREDASCLIRPQSLIGEKFVECEPTQPRAAGTEPPPPLEPLADGETGEGEYLLPLERNGKAVDLDLVNNIMEEPYPDRFRLILNDLGAELRGPRRRARRDHRARQPGPARDERGARGARAPEQGPRPARRRLRRDHRRARPRADPHLELHQPVRGRRGGDRRAQRRPRAVVRAVPVLPPRAAGDDGQPRRVRDRLDAGVHRPRRRRAVADPSIAGAGTVLERRHPLADHASAPPPRAAGRTSPPPIR